MKLKSPTGKPIKVQAINPNAGIETAYRKEMQTLIASMASSYRYWITATINQNPAKVTAIAQDSALTTALTITFTRLGKLWQKRFDKAADTIADRFASKTLTTTNADMMRVLKKAGFAIEFKPIASQQEAYKAVIEENIALIKSIPEQYHTRVQGTVWRGVTGGYDLASLSQELMNDYGITARRAALIAQDQARKAMAVMEQQRRLDLGIDEAEWKHSHAGKHPRESHVKAGKDKLRFKISEGAYIDGEWILPGTEINCLPGDSVIDFAAGCKKLWRRGYTGKLTKIITDSGEFIKATPNHPVLTNRGWVPIQFVNIGDYVIKISNEIGNSLERDIKRNDTTFAQIFNAASSYTIPSVTCAAGSEFHGDITDGKIETIDFDSFLPCKTDPMLCKQFIELFFSNANHIFIGGGFNIDSSLNFAFNRLFCAPQSIISGFCAVLSLLDSHSPHADNIGLRLIADLNAAFQKAITDCVSADPVFFGKLQLTNTGFVIGNNAIIRELFGIFGCASVIWNGDTPSADFLGDSIPVDPNIKSGSGKCFPPIYQRNRVVDKQWIDFFGHVYNLENWQNWYSGNSYIIHNCRCTSSAIID